MFNYMFAPTDHGWVWAYGYQFDSQASTVVVECSPQTWAGLGFDAVSAEEGVALLSELFKDQLGGHRLIAQLPDGTTARWLNFPTVTNKRWHTGNIVLAGDSAHTAHYSLGQGTTMALKDAIALADSLCLHADVETALTAYETRRKAELVGTLRRRAAAPSGSKTCSATSASSRTSSPWCCTPAGRRWSRFCRLGSRTGCAGRGSDRPCARQSITTPRKCSRDGIRHDRARIRYPPRRARASRDCRVARHAAGHAVSRQSVPVS